ncbi:MAG: YscO family type III secretion system apparatus protein [Pseudomonadota bacterium]
MDVIDGLLRLKKIRQDSREREMRQARGRLDDAARALREARELQQKRDRERKEQERAMYDDVCNRVVVLRNLDALRLDVEILQQEAQVDATQVTEAGTARDSREKDLTTAVQSWQDAARLTRKFTDLAEQAALERSLEAERLADLELEEHPYRPAPGFEDEEQAEIHGGDA